MSHLAYTVLRLLPRNALSRAVGVACRLSAPRPVLRAAIRAFARGYGVKVEEAERPLTDYATFTEFFTRRLRPGSRPIAPGESVPVSPVDGTVGEVGQILRGCLVQAKGREYTVSELLGGPDAEQDAAQFEGGSFLTFYLAPHDYHRIHAPLAGAIEGYTYVPGTLWPVNPLGVRKVERLFCVNERLTTWLRGTPGSCAVVAVGATCVGRIRAVYDDIVTNRARRRVARRVRYEEPIRVEKGGEMAIFEMGSTVVLLFARGMKIAPGVAAGASVKVGEALGELERAAAARERSRTEAEA